MAEKDRHLVWEALKVASRKVREEFPVDSDEGFEAMKRYAVEEYERLKEESDMRVVDGFKVAFVEAGTYFEGLHTPSMVSTARATGADVVFLLGDSVTEADITDEQIRFFLGAVDAGENEE